jgi:single-strand DNA-binding protein
MARTLNKVMIIGNVGNDPELKYTPSKIPVINFRMATSETRRDKSGNVIENTDWHSIVAWRGLAEVIHKLVKRGSRIYIEGKLQTRNFEDKQGNQKRVVEVVAETMLMLDKRKGGDDDHHESYGDRHEDSHYDDNDYSSSMNHYDGESYSSNNLSKTTKHKDSDDNSDYVRIEDVPF